MEFDLAIGTIWLIAGVLALLAEIVGAAGFGLFFVGFGAITVGALVNQNMIVPDNHLMQVVVFFAATALWAAILWKPLQKFRISRKSGGFNNIVGDTAMVGDKGVSAHDGEVLWSGTIMKAQLAPDAGLSRLGAGAVVEIVDMRGAMLIVKPKAPNA